MINSARINAGRISGVTEPPVVLPDDYYLPRNPTVAFGPALAPTVLFAPTLDPTVMREY